MAIPLPSGCARRSGDALPAEDEKVIETLLGVGVVGQALPSAPIDDTSVYFPLQERSKNYQVTGGPNAGSVQTLPVAKEGDRTETSPGGWLSPSLAGFIRQTERGDLVMPAVSDTGGRRRDRSRRRPTRFSSAGHAAGRDAKHSQTVSVNYLDDPTRRDYSGIAEGDLHLPRHVPGDRPGRHLSRGARAAQVRGQGRAGAYRGPRVLFLRAAGRSSSR